MQDNDNNDKDDVEILKPKTTIMIKVLKALV